MSEQRIVNSVNGEQMLAVPYVVDDTPGWRSVEGDNVFWGRLYVASTTTPTLPPSSGVRATASERHEA